MSSLRKIYEEKIKTPIQTSWAKFLKKPNESSQNSSSKFEKKNSDLNYYNFWLLGFISKKFKG